MNSLDALRKMVDHYPGGRPVMAARLGVTDEVLRKQLSGAPTHKHGVIDALEISDMCIEAKSEHCFEFVNAVAGRCGGFVKLPVVDMDRPTLQQCVTDAIREVSDVLTAALEGDADGVISDNDKARIDKEIAEARAALNAVELATRRKHAAGKLSRIRAV